MIDDEDIEREIEARAEIKAAQLFGRALSRLGNSPTAVAIERVLLPGDSLRESARQSGIPVSTLADAEKRLRELLVDRPVHPCDTLPS